MIKIFVCGQNVSGEYSPIASDSINYLEASFNFSPDWYGLVKTAQFTQNGKTYNVLLDKNKCVLPSELTCGFMDISVFGQEKGGDRRITTLPYSMVMKKSAFVSDAETPIPPTPDLYAQLIARVNDAVDEIPAKLSEFENDSGFITLEDIPEADVPTKLSELKNDSGFITLEDIPEVDVPTKLSELENDSGYITLEDIPEVDIPTKLSELQNDVGYIAPNEARQIILSGPTVDIEGGSVRIAAGDYGLYVSGSRVQEVGEPEDITDAATKGYVDRLVGDVETALDSIITLQENAIASEVS